MLRASVPRPWRVRGGDSPSACVPPALCSYLCNGKAGAVSANLIVAICPRLQSQPSYLCRRHFAPLSGGKARVRFLYFACARAAQVGGMCRWGGGGLAGRKCARRAARGAPGVLCARSTSRMVVGKAPVAARGALRALKPRATPRRRGEGSVARACCCRVSWQVRGQIVVGHVKFCQCPASATKIHPSIARHGMGRPPYQWQCQC